MKEALLPSQVFKTNFPNTVPMFHSSVNPFSLTWKLSQKKAYPFTAGQTFVVVEEKKGVDQIVQTGRVLRKALLSEWSSHFSLNGVLQIPLYISIAFEASHSD